jgi:hypothetical protein
VHATVALRHVATLTAHRNHRMVAPERTNHVCLTAGLMKIGVTFLKHTLVVLNCCVYSKPPQQTTQL